MSKENRINLNLGCGQVQPKSWINADSSLNALLQRFPFGKSIAKSLGAKEYASSRLIYMNLNKRWTRFATESVDTVYASHLFEHLSPHSAQLFLIEAFRVLKPGGTIRLVVPDLYAHSKEYTERYEVGDAQAYKQFMWALNLHREGQYPSRNFLHNLVGWIQGYPHQHKYMYDFYALSERLTSAGFKNIIRCAHGESSRINTITDLENEIITGYGNSLYIEAEKQIK